MDQQSKEQLMVAGIVAGDEWCFDQLHQLYYDRVFGFAVRRVGNPSDAEDITQETFLQIFRSIHSFRGHARLSTWIFGIAHNVTCKYFRNKAAQMVPLDNSEAIRKMSYQPFAESKLDAARALHGCTYTLSKARAPEHLEIFHLFYGLGRPLRSIANLTGKPMDSVKDSLRRSRNMLLRDVPGVRPTMRTAN